MTDDGYKWLVIRIWLNSGSHLNAVIGIGSRSVADRLANRLGFLLPVFFFLLLVLELFLWVPSQALCLLDPEVEIVVVVVIVLLSRLELAGLDLIVCFDPPVKFFGAAC